jgi:multidrug transporter EmrE-like cation transporter
LVLGGLAEFSNKVFQQYAGIEGRAVFLTSTFAVALVCSLATSLIRSAKWSRRDVLTGVAVGIPNLFSSYFLIQALQQVPAAVAYSVFGAGTVVTIAGGGIILFEERLQWREAAVIGLTIAGVIAVNV